MTATDHSTAIGGLIVYRAQQGVPTKIIKVKSHTGKHGNKIADQLANEAAEECGKSRQFDYDVSQLYSELKDKFWLQRRMQVQTAEGIHTEKGACRTYTKIRNNTAELTRRCETTHAQQICILPLPLMGDRK